jgi:hypothetical protein
VLTVWQQLHNDVTILHQAQPGFLGGAEHLGGIPVRLVVSCARERQRT